MKTIQWSDGADRAALASEAADILRGGGLVCLPCAGRYRIMADLESSDAVMELMQAKGRVRAAPALVFVDGEGSLSRVADDVHPLARRLAARLWPGPLTVRVRPSGELPSRVIKQLGGKKSRVGVRVPADALMREVVSAAGGPLLVSSANRERKVGESSAAQVRSNFGRRLELFVDGGDLSPGVPSTVIDIVDDEIVIERLGAIDAELLARHAQP